AILVPTAEEDPLIWLDILDRWFSLPVGYLFLTPEEAALVESRCDGRLPPSSVIGCGIEPITVGERVTPLAAPGVTDPFVLYLGRIDRTKGCESLLESFGRYLESGGPPVQLVMAGFANLPIPSHPRITYLGVVDDAQRVALMAHAKVIVVPSPFESLSMVLL